MKSKTLILIVSIIANHIVCLSQSQKWIYSFGTNQPNYTIYEGKRANTLIQTSDNGYCLGGQIEYITDPYGTQTRTHNGSFIIKLDSTYSMQWHKEFSEMAEWSYDIKSLVETSMGNIIFATDTELSSYPDIVRNINLSGIENWVKGPYEDSTSKNIEFGSVVRISDTLLFSCVTPGVSNNGYWCPMLLALNDNGDTLFKRNYCSYLSSTYYGLPGQTDITKDLNGNIYFSFWSDKTVLKIFRINTVGDILETHSIIRPSTFTNMSPYVFINANKYLIIDNSSYNSFHIYDSTGVVIDSLNFSFYLYGLKAGLNDELLVITRVYSSAQNIYNLPIGNYLTIFDANADFKRAFYIGEDQTDAGLNAFQFNNSEYFVTGMRRSSVSNSDALLMKISPQFIPNTLTCAKNILCSLTDSILITAPISASYRWSTGDSASQIYAKQAGNYFAFIFDSLGNFVVSDPVKITSDIIAVPNLGNDTTICNSQQLFLDAGTGFAGYQWQDGSNQQFFVASTNSTTIDSVYYSVIVSDSNNCFSYDSMLVVFDVCSKISLLDGQSGIDIYPNPANDIVTIKFPEGIEMNELFIYDKLGVLVGKMELNNDGIVSKDISELSPGIYSIRMVSDYSSSNIRFIITH